MAGAKRRERFTVGEFPRDGLYRLDWVGPLQARESGQRFPVQFSRVRDEIGKITGREADFETRKVVSTVGFGFAPVLQPGTVWADGSFRSRWPFNRVTIDVRVGPQCPIVGAYARHQIRGREWSVIPAGQFKIDGRVAGSRMVLFNGSAAGKRAIVIIPCMEIFRFYYGHSSRLAFRILRGAMASAPHWIYDAAGSWADPSGSARIELPPTMDVSDAYTIARFVLVPVGLKRAAAIITRAAIAQRGTLPIDVLPPFDGPWRVRASGKWLSYGGSRAFLVFALMRCEAPAPFKELTVLGGSIYGDWRSRAERKEPSDTGDRRRAVAPATSITALSSESDLNALRVRLPTLDTDKRFPEVKLHYALLRKRPKGRSHSSKAIRSVPKIVRRVGVSDEKALGGPDSGRFTDALRGSDEALERRDLLELFQHTLNVLPALAQRNGLHCTIKRRILDFSEVYSVEAPPWTSLGKETDAFRALHLADVEIDGLHVLLVDVQRRPGTTEQFRTLIACDTSFQEIVDGRLSTLLMRLSSSSGHLRNLDGVPLLREVRLSGANHLEHDTPEQFGLRILAKMVDLIDSIAPGTIK